MQPKSHAFPFSLLFALLMDRPYANANEQRGTLHWDAIPVPLPTIIKGRCPVKWPTFIALTPHSRPGNRRRICTQWDVNGQSRCAANVGIE